MLHCVALVGTYISVKLSASFIMVTRIGEVGTTLAVTSNRCTLRRASVASCSLCCSYFTNSCPPYEGGTTILRNVGSYKSHTAQHPKRHHSS
jgi:hypothetical protein